MIRPSFFYIKELTDDVAQEYGIKKRASKELTYLLITEDGDHSVIDKKELNNYIKVNDDVFIYVNHN